MDQENEVNEIVVISLKDVHSNFTGLTVEYVRPAKLTNHSISLICILSKRFHKELFTTVFVRGISFYNIICIEARVGCVVQ